MIQGKLLYLSRADIESLHFSMTDVISSVEKMFLEKAAGRVEMPPKPGIHPRKDAFIHAMPAFIPAMKAAGMKWVSGFPENQKRGLPYISGLLILNDPESGIPLSVMDCTWITAMRTAAASAVAAKYCARPESSTLAIIACGVQGRSHMEAFRGLFPLKKVWAYDLHTEKARAFAREMSAAFQVDVVATENLQMAVSESDLVVTSGPILKEPRPPIAAGWMKPGSFASLVDFDSYFQGAALREMERLITDDCDQLNYYRKQGYFKETPEISIELSKLVSKQEVGRRHAQERIAAINLGIALEDMAVAVAIYARASEMGVGTKLSL